MVVPERADVVVVGGGPAGSATATHLASAGLEVVVFDKARFPREKACAEYCSPGVVDALDDLGVLDRIRSLEHQSLPAMNVVARDQVLPLEFTEDRPHGNGALGIRRSLLDAELLDFAADAGAHVAQDIRVTRPVLENGTVTGVHYRNGAGEHAIQADFVVAADGLHSPMARSLGLERPVRWPRRLGLVARFDNLREQVRAGQMHIGDGLYCGMSAVSEDEVNVSLVVPMDSKPSDVSIARFFEQSLQRLPGISRLLCGARRISKVRGLGPMGKRVSARSGSGFLLVGDAAGFFDPLTGEGIHRALRGGELAARSTLTALSRPDRQPVSYEQARTSYFNDKERVCWIIQLLLTSPKALDYAAGRAVRRDDVNQTLRGILGDYEPARSALHPSFLWNLLKP